MQKRIWPSWLRSKEKSLGTNVLCPRATVRPFFLVTSFLNFACTKSRKFCGCKREEKQTINLNATWENNETNAKAQYGLRMATVLMSRSVYTRVPKSYFYQYISHDEKSHKRGWNGAVRINLLDLYKYRLRDFVKKKKTFHALNAIPKRKLEYILCG